jgi:hypothetical protein
MIACMTFEWDENEPPRRRGLNLTHRIFSFVAYSLKSQEVWEGNMARGTSFNMEEEFAGLDFHSVRLEERFVRTMETLMRQPEASIWEASENRAEASD